MKFLKLVLIYLLMVIIQNTAWTQCNQTLIIHSYEAECIASGVSQVDINITVMFGNGNNSATLSYNIGGGNVVAVVIEDDDGDVIEKTYSFAVPSCNNFNVILTGWSNPSGSGSSCSDPAPVSSNIILPVSFAHFRATQKADNVVLNWSTLVEINNEKFDIERSFENERFKRIGTVAGAVNSLDLIDYEFLDDNISEGTYYYRIKQVDLDGNYSYSDLSSIKVENLKSAFNIYPNPATDFIFITAAFNSPSYQIFNAQGKLIMTFISNFENDKIDISELESGMYHLISLDGKNNQSFVKY